MQGSKLVHVPNTADCFRATVRCSGRSMQSKGVAFHIYSLPEDRCTRLLIKGLGKNIPEQDVREEVEILGIPVQLSSQRRDHDPVEDRFPTPHFIVKSDSQNVPGSQGTHTMQNLPALQSYEA